MSEHAALLPRYKHLREVALRLNNRLVETLSKAVLDEGGKKLGILKKNVLTLDSEDEIAVLMDYCVYDVRERGLNAVERYLAESPPPADSDEMVLLQAMRQAWYSLFVVESSERGVGVHVRDLLRDESLFLVDVGFSQTASAGLIVAGRLMAPEGVVRTTGAALPLGVLPPENREQVLEGLRKFVPGADFRGLPPEQASQMTARIIRLCLERGAAERIRYQEPGRWSAVSRGPVAQQPARRVGRNDPCPCGSGRKFKHCCGRR